MRRQVVVTGMRGARLLQKQSRVEALGLRPSQVIVVTRTSRERDVA